MGPRKPRSAIAHPTDARLYEKARLRLVKLAHEADLPLRQSYARLGPWLAMQAGRYAHARQFERMRRALRRLKGYAGRVMRDLARRLCTVGDDGLRGRLEAELALAERLLAREPKDKRKLYAARTSRTSTASPRRRAVGLARQTPRWGV